MLTSFSKWRFLRQAALAFAIAATACTPRHGIDLDPDRERSVSRYADDRVADLARDSDAEHIPQVPHTAEMIPMAEEASPRYGRALHAARNGDSETALAILKELAEEFPLLSGPLVNKGLIHLQHERFDKAESALQKAIKISPGNPYAHNALGVALREQGQFDEAMTHYRTALQLDPLYARAHFNVGVLAELYMQDLELALKHFREYQTLQREPDQSVANWIEDLGRRVNHSTPEMSLETDYPGKTNDIQPEDES